MAYVTNSYYPSTGEAFKLELHINMNYYNDIDPTSADGATKNTPQAGYLDRTLAHEFTHAIMAAKIKNFNNLPAYIKEGMAEVVHGIDDQRTRDIQTLAGDASKLTAALSSATSATAMLDDAVKTASNSKWTAMQALINEVVSEAGSGGTNLLSKAGIDLTNYDTGAITGKDAGTISTDINGKDIVKEQSQPSSWSLPTTATSTYEGLKVIWDDGYTTTTSGTRNTLGFTNKKLHLHVGTESNQAINIGFYDLRAKALGLINAKGEKLSVVTVEKANTTIGRLDLILGRVLNQQTDIGAVQQRLEFTADNIITMSENTQGSESTIRDADMAKEMTAYTKANVLMQTAQAMLAQANRQSGAALALLR